MAGSNVRFQVEDDSERSLDLVGRLLGLNSAQKQIGKMKEEKK